VAAAFTALVGCFYVLDVRFGSSFPRGLDYASTFSEGLCTQPLGFVLFAAWIAAYLNPLTTRTRFVTASILLALTALASYFSVVAALPFACVGLALDARRNDGLRRLPGAAFGALLCAFLLSAFWAIPFLKDYSFFVTSPLRVSLRQVMPPGAWIWVWYASAFAGAVLIFVRGSARLRGFMIGCCGLLLLIVLSFVPLLPILRWIPSQPPRLISTFNLLLSIPIGWLLASLLLQASKFQNKSNGRLVVAAGLAVASVTLFVCIRIAPLDLSGGALYSGEPSIAGVLDFAQQHRDGRYIVENPWKRVDQYDSRALSAYLGMQGNESLSVIFHEASPASVFFTPVVNALSGAGDSFGISAALADDIDFFNQPPEQHIARARTLGVHYIACITPSIKRRFRQQPELIEHPMNRWSVFELKVRSAPEAEVLSYLPALVVSPLDFKQRQISSYSFTRLAEEQFNSSASDVLLASAETQKIDKLEGLGRFGALVLDTYHADDENMAYEKLRRFAQERSLILLSSTDPLYRRLVEHIAELPHTVIIQRQGGKQTAWFGAASWLSLDGESLRNEWKLIEEATEKSKVPVDASGITLSSAQAGGDLAVRINGPTSAMLPVLVRTTFHPGWRRSDGLRLYPATPFFMLTFADRSFQAKFKRDGVERASLVVSGCMLSGLVLALLLVKGSRFRVKRSREQVPRAVAALLSH
jgi:hypothetical protein